MNIVLINIAISVVMLAVFYILIKNKISSANDHKQVLEKVDNEIKNILIEMNNTTDRNISIIEDRIRQLKQLVEMADKRLTLLKKEPAVNMVPVLTGIQEKAINMIKIPKKRTFKEQVLDLHDKGIEPKLIAAKLEANIGEVELIISLAKGAGQ